MDRFLFHNQQYRLLDAVRDRPWAGAPIPFAECGFEFLDSGLRVNAYVLQGGGILRTSYRQSSGGLEAVSLGCAEVMLHNGRWPDEVSIRAWDRMTAPPDCVYEFLRFYQRLSVYLSSPKNTASLAVVEGSEAVYKAVTGPDGEPRVESIQGDRIISLEPLTEVERKALLPQEPHEPKKQQHPCEYEHWVRGHMRHYKNGRTVWVEPFKRNKGKAEKSKIYTLKEADDA